MKLGEWLKQEKMSQAAFAAFIDSDQGHVSDLVLGKVQPTVASIEAISVVTKGEVAYADWPKKEWKKPQVKTAKRRMTSTDLLTGETRLERSTRLAKGKKR